MTCLTHSCTASHPHVWLPYVTFLSFSFVIWSMFAFRAPVALSVATNCVGGSRDYNFVSGAH